MGKQERERKRLNPDVQSSPENQLSKYADSDSSCPLCYKLLSTPIKICQHYVDYNCYAQYESSAYACNSCKAPIYKNASKKLHEYRVDEGKIAYIANFYLDNRFHSTYIESVVYNLYLYHNTRIRNVIADFAIKHAK